MARSAEIQSHGLPPEPVLMRYRVLVVDATTQGAELLSRLLAELPQRFEVDYVRVWKGAER